MYTPRPSSCGIQFSSGAFVRSIEIIGEASKKLPRDFTAQHPETDWRVMAGMRDRLIHGYFAIDYDIVWNVAAQEALTLKRQIEQILALGCG